MTKAFPLLCICTALLLPQGLCAQSNTNQFAFIAKLDNDYFTGTDYYYTNGAEMGILLQPAHEVNRNYQFTISQDIYTPSSITDQSFRVNDHPYAGLLKVQANRILFQPDKNFRSQHFIDLGVLGPSARAAETQTWFHRLTRDPIPQGWHHQVHTKVIVNYGNFFEKRMFNLLDRVESLVGGGIFLGTLKSGLDVTVKGRLGLLQPYFISPFADKILAAELFSELHFMYLINNGVLSTKNRAGVPVVDESFVNNEQSKFTTGIRLRFHSLQGYYAITRLTKPFEGATRHRYGTIGLIVFI